MNTTGSKRHDFQIVQQSMTEQTLKVKKRYGKKDRQSNKRISFEY